MVGRFSGLHFAALTGDVNTVQVLLEVRSITFLKGNAAHKGAHEVLSYCLTGVLLEARASPSVCGSYTCCVRPHDPTLIVRQPRPVAGYAQGRQGMHLSRIPALRAGMLCSA